MSSKYYNIFCNNFLLQLLLYQINKDSQVLFLNGKKYTFKNRYTLTGARDKRIF